MRRRGSSKMWLSSISMSRIRVKSITRRPRRGQEAIELGNSCHSGASHMRVMERYKMGSATSQRKRFTTISCTRVSLGRFLRISVHSSVGSIRSGVCGREPFIAGTVKCVSFQEGANGSSLTTISLGSSFTVWCAIP